MRLKFPTVEESKATVPLASAVVLPVPAENDLSSAVICDTGSVEIDNQLHVVRWVNQTGYDLLIVAAYDWIGIDYKILCDCGNRLYRTSDYSIVVPQMWDRYAFPNAPNGVYHVLPSPGMLLTKGDALEFQCMATADPNDYPSGLPHQQHAVAVWAKRA